MGDRSLLGPADLDDTTLRGVVADLLGHPTEEVAVGPVSVERVAYDVPALTTVARWWVSGTARTPDGEESWRVFVKHVQAWRHSAFFAHVPEPVREVAAAGYPWRNEAAAYRSDLRDRLPAGLTMPRALAVVDLDPDPCPESWVAWLEDVTRPAVPWDRARYERAAYLLGRLAGSPAVAPLAGVGGFDWSIAHYVTGRLRFQVLPALADDALWAHPAVAAAFGDLREELLAATVDVDVVAAELDAAGTAPSHGDACPANLLPGPEAGSFTVIDLGFWQPQPLGFDLTQLVAGALQLGVAPPVPLPELSAACVAAYAEGLAAEGRPGLHEMVRRHHAMLLWLFAGVSAVPFEQLGSPPESLAATCALRADLARHSLDLLAADV
ncbi:aminoglycoside phosphotransferase family protein [Nocardioides sp. CFH 31398]|uniref:aminoglycoside phosphotransferase family protein n=1 Tax=Nocardioides sp. CFH 31398 TaxID=2919579 RepID=UPI001F055670|nr:aminoglycoside phosphotransferase family protein [Nocardioides sp. CFH 31398]MCH1866665.1 aminoglycoside phosphotransferase family protein [Nocardioides sp. CFH 31398]